jgi:hypothetical protein
MVAELRYLTQLLYSKPYISLQYWVCLSLWPVHIQALIRVLATHVTDKGQRMIYSHHASALTSWMGDIMQVSITHAYEILGVTSLQGNFKNQV